MSRMVYIKQVYPNSFLHLSTSGEGFALRDFSPADQTEARVVKRQLPPEWTTARILQLASVAGNFLAEVPEQPISNYRYWHDETEKLNRVNRVTAPDPTPSQQPTIVVHTQPVGVRGYAAYVIATVIAAVATAGILFWLKWR
jgi:hypothetical protein